MPMDLVKIDIICLEALEGALTSPYDVEAAVSVFIYARAGDKIVKALSGAALSKVDFCYEENLVASFVSHEGAADYALAFPFGIYVASIQKIDACIESPFEHEDAFLFRRGISKIIRAKT
jgi:hypothetical protein